MSESDEVVKKEEEVKGDEEEVVSSSVKPEVKEEQVKLEKPVYKQDVIDGITERLQFFFSDANIRQDFFMKKHLLYHTKDKFKYAGYVPIESLIMFNTIKKYTNDSNVLRYVVQNLLNDTLKLSDDNKAITTVIPFTKEKMDDNIPLSLYVSNMPLDDKQKKYQCSVDDLRDMFSQYGKIALIKFRFQRRTNSNGDDIHDDDGDIQPSTKQENTDDDNNKKNNHHIKYLPIGAAFIEYTTIDSLENAANDVLTKKDGISCEPKRVIKIQDNDLDVILLKDFLDEKKKRKLENNDNKSNDNNQEKSKEEQDEKTEVKDNDHNNRNINNNNKDKYVMDWKTGCVIRLKGLSDQSDREAILDAICTIMNVTKDEIKEMNIYIDYSRGQDDGAIRFIEPNDDIMKRICEQLSDGTIKIANEVVASAYILQNDEEQQYWDNFIEFKTMQKRSRDNDNHRGGGRGGRGGRGGGGRGGGGGRNNHHQNKKQRNR